MNRIGCAVLAAVFGSIVAVVGVVLATSATVSASRPTSAGESGGIPSGSLPTDGYPWHTNIVATTFWVGEIFDPNAADGSQVYSTYDSNWASNYGGCDGVLVTGVCSTEVRTASNGYFPSQMTPRQNPFYLDLPYDDVNNPAAFAQRGSVIPWAQQAGFKDHLSDPSVSLMKNRWVELRRGTQTCFGQIEDAGPGQYDDAAYVFGSADARPQNTRYGGAGMDVSPALNGCLGFADLNGDTDTVSWRFVDDTSVTPGPWTTLVTTTGLQ
ncbi:hypothetical protein [Subtercola vilae]|uniref:Uncharacterized protein n=1 Tax=Subtercola vilae TaxID=2056433 RepID=A0A4T2BN53_9MICO|nr:hypothetical protein [Subtercola vilae]TIH33025.1 hypothetical protein D4765_15345 [Subtercola vilae]